MQDLDEEAGYDDYYSGDEDEYEDEEEEEEERQPPKEELEYLELRQKLKESIRKNMGKGSANAQSSQERRRKLPYNEYVVANYILQYPGMCFGDQLVIVFFCVQLWFLLWSFTACYFVKGYTRKQIIARK